MATAEPLQGFPYPDGTDDARTGDEAIRAAVEAIRLRTNMIFASSAARTSAFAAASITLGASHDGLLSYLQDVNRYESWNGAAWLPLVGGLIKRGNRTSDKGSITSETGILRVDSIVLVNGHRYAAHCTPSRVGSGSDTYVQKLRVNQTGTATTASTQIASAESNDSGSKTVQGFFTAAADSSTCSVILTAARATGASSGTWVAEGSFCMEIYDTGVDTGDSGVDL